ncbi:response regulator [Mariniflexile ostreae]|uniref:histidine kinase n=1 Tax=Mariniflexile ostreae TaxID=1520892 RepID=A0ABV5F815_9FLAO
MKTILIVDDKPENLYLLRVILENKGYLVIEAKHGQEGLDKLHHSKVDLIISDILMPIMDGYIFCQACKKERIFKKIPFIFYTSTYTEQPDEEFALKLGAATFIKKPIDHEDLLAIVEDVLDKVKSQRAYVKRVRINDEEVLKIYSERLINKLEDKTLELNNEILERNKIEQVLIHKNQVMDLITQNTPLNKVLEHIILNFESSHPSYFGSVNLLHPDGHYLETVSAPNLPKDFIVAIGNIPIGENKGSCGTAAFLKKAVIVSNISKDALWADFKDIASKFKLKSCWSIPIIDKEGMVLGTFAMYSHKSKIPSLEDIKDLNHSVGLVIIAIQKNNSISEIKKVEESYKSLIEQATDAIIAYSFDGTIYSFNTYTSSMLGYSNDEFKELRLSDLIEGAFIEDPEKYKKVQNGETVLFNKQLIHKNKTRIDVEISTKLQKDGRFLGIARDVTERKRTEIILKEKNLALTKSNEELDRFVYSASHDLRAPLTSLRGLINITESSLNPDQEEQKLQMQMMSKTIDKMDAFINDILDYSTNSRTQVETEKIDFNELIDTCWDKLKYQKKNEKIITFVNQQTDFFSDKKRIEIIFNSIFSNSLKYYDVDKKEHIVKTSVHVDSESATIIVEDNGIGIEEKYLDNIFDMFYRATKHSTGSGMGMYIVKETIDKLKGTIKVASELSKGSTFTVSLPNLK